MRMKPTIASVAIVLLLAACSTLPDATYNNTRSEGSAVIEAPFPNVLGVLSSKRAAMYFVEIDGVQVKQSSFSGYVRKVYVEPGNRSITVNFKSGSLDLTSGQFTTELNVNRCAHYLLTADVVGIDYDLSIWDITKGSEAKVLIKKERTTIRSGSRLNVVPVVIPR